MPRSPELLLPRKGSVPTAGCHGNPSSHPLPWTREDQTPGEAPQHPREPTLLVKKRARSRERLKSQLIPPRSVPLPRASRRGVSEKPEKTSAPVINHHRDHLAPAEAAVTCCHLLSKWPEPPAASQALGDTGSCCWHGLGSVLNSWAGSAPQLLLPGIPSYTWMGQGGFKNNPRGGQPWERHGSPKSDPKSGSAELQDECRVWTGLRAGGTLPVPNCPSFGCP